MNTNSIDKQRWLIKKASKLASEILANTLKQKWSDGKCEAVNNK